MGRMVEHFSSAGLRAFDTQAVQVQKKFQCLEHFLPFWNLGLCWNISDHHGTFKIILDYIGSCHNFRQFQAISDQFGPFQPIHDDFLVVFLGHFLSILEHLLAILDNFQNFLWPLLDHLLTILNHFLTFPDHFWLFLVGLNHYWTALSRLEHSVLYVGWDGIGLYPWTNWQSEHR